MTENPFLKRMSKQGKTGHGNRAEGNLSKRLGLQQQPASGAMDGAKGDLKGVSFLVESKATSDASISVTRTWLTKIKFEARDQNRDPALAINFVTGDGKPQPYGSWVLIEERMFKRLMEQIDDTKKPIGS